MPRARDRDRGSPVEARGVDQTRHEGRVGDFGGREDAGGHLGHLSRAGTARRYEANDISMLPWAAGGSWAWLEEDGGRHGRVIRETRRRVDAVKHVRGPVESDARERGRGCEEDSPDGRCRTTGIVVMKSRRRSRRALATSGCTRTAPWGDGACAGQEETRARDEAEGADYGGSPARDAWEMAAGVAGGWRACGRVCVSRHQMARRGGREA